MPKILGVLMLAVAMSAHGATVLFDGDTEVVDRTLADPTDLWIPVTDLTRVNGFELKPEGACLNSICVPVRQDRDSDLLITRQDERWFNVTELAAKLRQPVVVDHEAGVWSFGAIPTERAGFVRDGEAPDFTLPDWRGETHSLSDFKGKKIMLLSWASW